MIVICELQFSNWGHEEANCGFLNLMAKEFPYKKIYFYGEKSHISCLHNIGLSKRIKCNEICIKENPSLAAYKENESYFSGIIKKIMDATGLSKNDFLFFLSSPKTFIPAFLSVAKNVDFKTFFIEHANMDWLLSDSFEKGLEYSLLNIINSTKDIPNVRFIAYNPYCKKTLKTVLERKVLNKFYFIHHMPSLCRKKICVKDEVVTIGVYGAASSDENFRSLLEVLYQKYENLVVGKIEFHVIRKIMDRNDLDCSFLYPKFCVVNQTIDGFSREQRELFLNQMNWILIPYDSTKYRVSMSGILADAIGFEKPILGLNSPILEFYNNKAAPIGIIKNTVEELASFIANDLLVLSKIFYNRYIDNQKKMKQIISDENSRLIRRVVNS